MSDTPVWVQVTEIVTGALVPLSIAVVGWLLHGRLKAIEERTANAVEIRKLRVACFSEMAPLINALFCYGTYSGSWRDHSPDEILEIKRKLDALFFRNLFLWSNALVEGYRTYMECCFVTSNGPGTSARSRASVERHRCAYGEQWKPGWDARFVPVEQRTRRRSLQHAYANLHQLMAASIGHELSQQQAEASITGS
jgi:hypothetical protein